MFTANDEDEDNFLCESKIIIIAFHNYIYLWSWILHLEIQRGPTEPKNPATSGD